MGPYEQDLVELGFRVAKAMHYQTRWARSYLVQATVKAEGVAEELGPSPRWAIATTTRATRNHSQ
jgi:hypothetical protein